MSSPIERSFDTEGVSPYAPKWARDLDSMPKQDPVRPRLHLAGGGDKAKLVERQNFEAEHFQPPASLAPSLVPEPPIQKILAAR